jgi:hypothetical protein
MNSKPGAMIVERYQTALESLGALKLDVIQLRALDEAEVLRVNSMHAEAGRLLGSAGAVIAGDLAHRSRPALGGEGLARRTGHRTVENLVKSTTGATKEQAITAVRAGTLLTELADDGTIDQVTGEVVSATQPWLHPVALAVAAGTISTSASASIAAGLGAPNSAVSIASLRESARELVAQAIAGADADRLWRAARDLRDELDLVGVTVREDEARDLRGLTHRPLAAGGGVATWRMDPETYAQFVETYDRITSPKRGGVRFVDRERAAHADRIKDDDRSAVQLGSDGLLHLILAGANVDDSVMLGTGAPVIRITVAEQALQTGVGLARIDGQSAPVTLETAKRLLCEGETQTIGFDSYGHHIGIGSDARLYNRRQREVLAAKFGVAWIRTVIDPHPGARPTTSCSGRAIMVERSSITASCSANTITSCTTTRVMRSGATTRAATGRCRRRRSTLDRNRFQCRSRLAIWQTSRAPPRVSRVGRLALRVRRTRVELERLALPVRRSSGGRRRPRQTR